MTVIAVNRDPVALTLTIVAEFDTLAERALAGGPTPGSWNDGGDRRPTPPPSSTTI
jgi:hypothetical protein